MGDRAVRLEYAAALVFAALAGTAVTRRPELALPGIGAAAFVLALAVLGDRALAWFVTVAAVLPYFPLTVGFEGEAVVPPTLLPALILLAAAGPFAWSVATRRSQLPPTRGHLLFVATALLVLLLSLAESGTEALTTFASGGFLIGLATYVCARRFASADDWLAPAVVGLAVLMGWGAAEFSANPDERIGWFTGYPILYAGLVVMLLPPALAWAYPRSRALAAVLTGGSVLAIVLSQTRSAWLALAVMILLVLALLIRRRRAGAVGLLVVAMIAVAAAIASSDELSEVLATRLSARDLATTSVTHREFSYGYTLDRFQEQPLFGHGVAGALKEDIEARTGITAADNGFLSLAGDLGLLGLLLGLVPAAAAGLTVVRAWSEGVTDAELALALGLAGMLVVTLFFDTYYWPQSAALMYAVSGVLMACRQAARRAAQG
jgi:O-antigen ligase